MFFSVLGRFKPQAGPSPLLKIFKISFGITVFENFNSSRTSIKKIHWCVGLHGNAIQSSNCMSTIWIMSCKSLCQTFFTPLLFSGIAIPTNFTYSLTLSSHNRLYLPKKKIISLTSPMSDHSAVYQYAQWVISDHCVVFASETVLTTISITFRSANIEWLLPWSFSRQVFVQLFVCFRGLLQNTKQICDSARRVQSTGRGGQTCLYLFVAFRLQALFCVLICL